MERRDGEERWRGEVERRGGEVERRDGEERWRDGGTCQHAVKEGISIVISIEFPRNTRRCEGLTRWLEHVDECTRQCLHIFLDKSGG
jgi:hypothetical protein